jgi:type IX secretion system PorP/SprF family membrane protein
MRIIVLTILFFSCIAWQKGNAQQETNYSQYFLNPMLINPATSGANEQTSIGINHKNQWSGMPGNPVNNTLTLGTYLYPANTGIGFRVFSDSRGIFKRISIDVPLAYHVKVAENSFLSLGLAPGIINQQIDFARISGANTDDPLLLSGNLSHLAFSNSAGITYYSEKIEAGISIPHVISGKARYSENGKETSSAFERNFVTHFRYNARITEDIEIIPVVLLRAMPASSLQIDLNVYGQWKKSFFAGLTYRSGYAAAMTAGLRLKNLAFAYSYDLVTSVNPYHLGLSHEISLVYSFIPSGTKEEKIKKHEKDIEKLAMEIEELEISLKEREEYILKLIDEFYSTGPTDEIQTQEDIDYINNELGIYRQQVYESIRQKQNKIRNKESEKVKIKNY